MAKLKLLKCSLVAGAGKSTAAAKKTAGLLRAGKRVMIMSSSIELLRQTAEDVRHLLGKPTRKDLAAGRTDDAEPEITIRAIYGKADEHDGSVTEGKVVTTTAEAISEAKHRSSGTCLLVTHECFSRLSVGLLKGWRGFYDEADEVVTEFNIRMGRYHWIVTNHLRAEPLGAKYVELVPKWGSRKELDAIYKNADGNVVDAAFKDIAGFFADRNHRVFTSKEQWEKLLAGKTASEQRFVVIKGPGQLKQFSEVTVMSALFECTGHHILWERQWDVEWEEDTELAASARYTSHPNGHLIAFMAPFTEPATRDSKGQLAFGPGGPTRDQFIKDEIRRVFTGDYVWCDNVKATNLLPEKPNPAARGYTNRMVNKPQGLNGKWETYTDIALLGTYNYNPMTIAILEELGFSSEEQEVDRNFLAWYQQLMRAGPRVPHITQRMRVISYTTRFGDWCKRRGLFEGCKSVFTPSVAERAITPLRPMGRPKVERTPEEVERRRFEKQVRNQANYQKKKEQILNAMRSRAG